MVLIVGKVRQGKVFFFSIYTDFKFFNIFFIKIVIL